MDDPRKLRTSGQDSGSAGWDGEPDPITPGQRDRISPESRHILFAACRAATMDGFLLVAVLVPATTDKNGYSHVDNSRSGNVFTNLAHGCDEVSLLQWGVDRLKGKH